MLDDKKLLETVERAYTESKTDCIREGELLEWLKKNGLSPEEVTQAIYVARKQRVIQFYYESIDGDPMVPCYERVTEEDLQEELEFEKERDEELTRRSARALKARKGRTK